MRKGIWLLAVVGVMLGLTAAVMAADGAMPMAAATPIMVVQPWTAFMTASQEVCDGNSRVACGSACFKLTPDGLGLRYTVEVSRMWRPEKVTLHLGLAHQNGPLVACLYRDSTPEGWDYMEKPCFDGTLACGTLWVKDLKGPLAGQPLTALVALFHSHDVYVSVSTPCHCDGEIRGQIW